MRCHDKECLHLLPQPKGRVLENIGSYKEEGGCQGLAYARSHPQEVISVLKDSCLRGRGGAGFPTYIKWAGLAKEEAADKYVVCNGSEGEPGTYKDRYLLLHNPYLLIEGLLIAIVVTGAKRAVIGIKKKYTVQIARLREAITEYIADGLMQGQDIEIVEGPDEYLFGEEKALLEYIDTRANVMPRRYPPYLQGIYGEWGTFCPALVNNIETYSQVAFLLKDQGKKFSSVGTTKTKGTTIFTICGDVKYPGMYELPYGISLRTVLYEVAGGPINKLYDIKAVCSGVANPVMVQDMFDTPIDYEALREAKGGVGSAGFIVYDESAWMVSVVLTLSKFLAIESCGQCSPCKGGTYRIVECLEEVESGEISKEEWENIYKPNLIREASIVTKHTRCFLSQEASILLQSFIEKFDNEFYKVPDKVNRDRDIILGKIDHYDATNKRFIYQNYQFKK